RREQQRIQLVDVVDQLTVNVRQRRMEPTDAQRQALVEQLVRHHVPVGDLRRQGGEAAREGQPQRGEPERSEPRRAHLAEPTEAAKSGRWLSELRHQRGGFGRAALMSPEYFSVTFTSESRNVTLTFSDA